MKFRKLSEIPEQAYEHTTFVDRIVNMQPVITEDITKVLVVTNVDFRKEVRSKFHTYCIDQLFIIPSRNEYYIHY